MVFELKSFILHFLERIFVSHGKAIGTLNLGPPRKGVNYRSETVESELQSRHCEKSAIPLLAISMYLSSKTRCPLFHLRRVCQIRGPAESSVSSK